MIAFLATLGFMFYLFIGGAVARASTGSEEEEPDYDGLDIAAGILWPLVTVGAITGLLVMIAVWGGQNAAGWFMCRGARKERGRRELAESIHSMEGELGMGDEAQHEETDETGGPG